MCQHALPLQYTNGWVPKHAFGPLPVYLPDFPLMIYFCFQEYCSYDHVVSKMSLKFRNNHRLSSTQFQKGQFQQCQKHWTYCVNSEGACLKGIIMTNSKVRHTSEYQLSPGTFGHTLSYAWETELKDSRHEKQNLTVIITMYIQSNSEACSWNHCCHGKAISLTYFCVYVWVHVCRCGCECMGTGMYLHMCSLTNPGCNALPHCHLWPLIL